MRTYEQTLSVVDGVDGWMSPGQAAELYQAAAATHAGDQIVEIGSFRGRSTIVLASAAPPGVGIVAIDPHAGNDRGPRQIDGFEAEAADDHEVFVSNLVAAGVDSRVRHLRVFSHEALGEVEGEIAVLYIDAAHRYKPALADIREWGSRVAPSGTMLIHDSFSSVGVTLAIGRELLFGRRFRYSGRSRSLSVYHADLDGSRRSRSLNAAKQAAQIPWFIKNATLKLLLSLRLGGVIRRVTGREPEWPY
ncbi:MAG: class I SAM-dependent methyltransferase [Ilumatobacteraceae bacterium]